VVSHGSEHPLFAGNIAQYNADKHWRITVPMQTAGKPIYWRQRTMIRTPIRPRKAGETDA
jgi:hypothetical protein